MIFTLEKLKRQKKKAPLTNINWEAKLPVHHTVESDRHKSMWPVCDSKSEHIYVTVTKYSNAIHSVLLLRDVLKQVLNLWKGKANLLAGNEFLWKFKETHCLFSNTKHYNYPALFILRKMSFGWNFLWVLYLIHRA